MIETIIYNIASVFAIILFISSVQFEKKKDILLVQTFASFCYMVSYYILGALSGFYTEIVEQIKNITFIHFEKKNKKIPTIYLLIFLLLLIIIAIFTYDGIHSLIPLTINIIYFISSYIKNPWALRFFMIVCATLWGLYNFFVHAYIVIIGNVIEIISAIISLVRFKNDNKSK